MQGLAIQHGVSYPGPYRSQLVTIKPRVTSVYEQGSIENDYGLTLLIQRTFLLIFYLRHRSRALFK